MITVYILECADRRYYTGITKDLNRRMEQHNAGMSFSTRKRRPVKVVFTEEHPNYQQARIREKYIKDRGATRFLNWLFFQTHEKYA